MNQKKIIAVDVDDVIVETAPLIINHYNKTYGTNVALKDFYSNDPAIYGVADDTIAIQRVDEYLHSDEYRKAAPLQEAVAAARQLADKHELHVVTGRGDFLAKATESMLKEYFPDVFRSVVYTNFFHNTKARSKAEVCQELGADVLIDDHLHHALLVAGCGIDVLLFGNYPWNQSDSLPSNVRRIKNWPEIVEYFNGRA